MDIRKGPILNDISSNFTTRDSLGIESVAASISGEICPVVTTVTPRAFYWAFATWNYYDFLKNSLLEKNGETFVNKFLRRQDYYFVLSQVLNHAPDQNGLNAKTNVEWDKPVEGLYYYNPNYFSMYYGGMTYYVPGCTTMDMIRDTDYETNVRYSFVKMTPRGKDLAVSFEKVIENTEYYQKYRLLNVPVPEDVLMEYGQTINMSLDGFDATKEILRRNMFDERINKKLVDSSRYVSYIHEVYDMSEPKLDYYREALFDGFSVRGEGRELPEDLRSIADGWEIVVGRQYFTFGLESIWKYMLLALDHPMKKRTWIRSVIENSEWSLNLDATLASVLDNCNLSYMERENMCENARRAVDASKMVEDGLRVVLSMYNRFVDRSDFGEESTYLTWGYDSDSIAFDELISTVDLYKGKPIRDFLIHLMDEWLIEQHYRTAFEKMLNGRNGFYYEIEDGYYVHKHPFDLGFQGIRLMQLAQVMKDLDML